MQNLGWNFSGSVPGMGSVNVGQHGGSLNTPWGKIGGNWQQQNLGGVSFGHPAFGNFGVRWNQNQLQDLGGVSFGHPAFGNFGVRWNQNQLLQNLGGINFGHPAFGNFGVNWQQQNLGGVSF